MTIINRILHANRRTALHASLISRKFLHVISRSEAKIKPASPTSGNLNKYILPFRDRMFPDSYVPGILFYPNPQTLASNTAISCLLKDSLSETLTKYYPFAGRLSSAATYVDCNDEGVHFYEAHVACKLSEILEKTPANDYEEGFGHLFPPCSIWHKVMDTHLMSVQLNYFSCGGIAIAVTLTHRIADASTLFSFLNYWASLSLNPSDEEKSVHHRPFFLQELQPKSYDDLVSLPNSFPEKNWITIEIVFHNSKIAEMKADQEMQDKKQGIVADQNYRRNELVTAFLYRCAVAAAATSNSGPYVLFQLVNLRSLIDPPLPRTTVGNLITFNHIPTSTMNETMLNPLVGQIRKGKMQLRGIKSLEGTEVMPIMDKYAKTNHRPFLITSICNFPLYDQMDFGWGRPVKTSIVDTPFVDCFIMTDTPSGDGIQVIVSLGKDDMEKFRANKELLAYASF